MSKFDHLIENGYSFNMGEYFSEGWNLFKKEAGSFIGFGILMIIMIFILAFIPGISLLSGLFTNVLTAGIFLFCRGIKNGNQEFGQFFNGFNHFLQIFLHWLVLGLFSIPAFILIFTVLIPFEMLPELLGGYSDPEYIAEEFAYSMQDRVGVFIGTAFLLFIFYMYLYISYSFVIPLIVDEGMQFWDAMETSRKIVGKQFFSYFGMYIVIGIASIIGVTVTCFFGYFVVAPVTGCIVFAAYDLILEPKKGNDITSQLDEFGQKDDDINTESQDQ